MGTLIYKDFVGKVEYDYEDEMYFGKVMDTKHLIQFDGRTLEEAEKDFHEAVDDYLDFISSEDNVC